MITHKKNNKTETNNNGIHQHLHALIGIILSDGPSTVGSYATITV